MLWKQELWAFIVAVFTFVSLELGALKGLSKEGTEILNAYRIAEDYKGDAY